MKRVWKLSLGLSFGLFVTPAWSEEIQWRPASPRTPGTVQATENLSLVQPPAAFPPTPTSTDLDVPAIATSEPSLVRPAASLERPVPTRPVAVAEPPVVRPTGFIGPSDTSKKIVRGQGSEAPRAMPVGPSKDDGTPPSDGGSENVLKMPTPLPTGPAPTPLPVAPSGPIGVAPAPGGPVAPEIVSSGPVLSSEGPILGGEVFDGEVFDGEVIDGWSEGYCDECDEGVVVSPFRKWGLFGGHGGHGKHFGMHDGSWGWGDGWGGGLFGGEGEEVGSGERFYIRGEYLMWGISGHDVPPLVTGSLSRRVGAGRLGSPGTIIAYGGNVGQDALSGGRFTGGLWFGAGKRIGIEGNGFFLGPETTRSSFGSQGTPGVFRPFFNAQRGEDALRIAFPGQVSGVSIVDVTSQMSGAEANMLFKCYTGDVFRLVFLGGYRYLTLDETLQITDHVRTLPPTVPTTTTLRIDRFMTQNRFNGGQVGLQGDFNLHRFTIGLSGKLAMGGVTQTLDVDGVTLTNNGRRVRQQPGGLLAMPSNKGRFQTNHFALVPEFGVTVGYQVTDWMRLYAGYNLLYVGNVIRPGEQIDRVVNRSQITPRPRGAQRPILPFDTTDFFAHGLTAGLEFKY